MANTQKKTARRSKQTAPKRWNLEALEGAREDFMALAKKETRPDVRDALERAAVITYELSVVVEIGEELRTFFRGTVGWDR